MLPKKIVFDLCLSIESMQFLFSKVLNYVPANLLDSEKQHTENFNRMGFASSVDEMLN